MLSFLSHISSLPTQNHLGPAIFDRIIELLKKHIPQALWSLWEHLLSQTNSTDFQGHHCFYGGAICLNTENLGNL